LGKAGSKRTTSPSLPYDAPQPEAELLMNGVLRSSQNAPLTNFRLCDIALLGHRHR
jgi:hypothetical protein